MDGEGRRRTFRWAAAIFGLALLIRAAWAIQWSHQFQYMDFHGEVLYDSHYEVAKYFAGFPDVPPDTPHRPPLYAWFLALWLLIFGERIGLIMAVQSLISALTALFPFWLGRRYGHERAGLWGSFLMAVDPLLVYFAPHLMAEVLYVPLFLISLGLAIAAFETGSLVGAAAAGLAAGATALVRVTFIPFYLAVPVLAGFVPKRRGRVLAQVALLWMGLAFVTVPWAIRNYLKFNHFTISYYMGRGLYEGLALTWEETQTITPEMVEEMYAHPQSEIPWENEILWDDIFRRRALVWIRDHPGEYAAILFRKALKSWRLFPYQPYPLWVRWGVGCYFALLFPLAFYGAWLFRVRREASVLLWLFLLVTTLLHMVFFSTFRYRSPIEPILCLWAGVALEALWRRWSRLPT